VRIFGDEVDVRATVHTIGGLSAHADQSGLLGWLRGFRQPPRRTYVVHGEYETARKFCAVIQRELGWPAETPAGGQVVEI
jgi:metallo-beta-lactamase family protein